MSADDLPTSRPAPDGPSATVGQLGTGSSQAPPSGTVAAESLPVGAGSAEVFPAGASSSRAETERGRRSGLRDPASAVRALGAGTLLMEAILLLLAIQPIRLLGGRLGCWAVGVVVGLAVLAGLLAGTIRRRWGWHAGSVLQLLLLLAGLLHWSLGVLGLIFGAVWAYATHVRLTILR